MEAEIEKAVGQLLGAGLITADDGMFGLTREGVDLYDRTKQIRGGALTHFLNVAERWKKNPPVKVKPVVWKLAPRQLDGPAPSAPLDSNSATPSPSSSISSAHPGQSLLLLCSPPLSDLNP